jgi:hypothetical protein
MAPYEIAFADAPLQALCNVAQDNIARLMPESIVDRLESVEVEKQYRKVELPIEIAILNDSIHVFRNARLASPLSASLAVVEFCRTSSPTG